MEGMARDVDEVKRILLGDDPDQQRPDEKGPTKITDDDLADSDNAHQIKHGERYSDILSAYQEHVTRTLFWKFIFKLIFFFVSMAVLVASPIIFFKVFLACSASEAAAVKLSTLLPLGAALIQFLTSYLVLPRIIAEYLFNIGEETSVVSIVENMQKYDMEIRKRKKEH